MFEVGHGGLSPGLRIAEQKQRYRRRVGMVGRLYMGIWQLHKTGGEVETAAALGCRAKRRLNLQDDGRALLLQPQESPVPPPLPPVPGTHSQMLHIRPLRHLPVEEQPHSLLRIPQQHAVKIRRFGHGATMLRPRAALLSRECGLVLCPHAASRELRGVLHAFCAQHSGNLPDSTEQDKFFLKK